MVLKFTNIFSILVLLVINFSCKDNITGQLKTKEDLNYKWTIDTLYYTPNPQTNGDTFVNDIWGANDSCVFAVGHDVLGGRGSIWKFNGKEWQREKIFKNEGGTFTQALSLNGLMGFTNNNIYAFGVHVYSNSNPPPILIDSALIIHYDGNLWKEIPAPNGSIIYKGAAVSPIDFYCGGSNGQLYHYNFGRWKIDTIKLSQFPELPFYNISVESYKNNEVYIETVQYNPNNGLIYYQFLLYTENGVTILDSTTSITPKWGTNSFWQSPSGKLFSAGTNGIYLFEKNMWNKFNSMETISSIYGTNDNHIFALGVSGKLYFYNGTTWNVIATIASNYPVYGRIWCTNSSIFIAIPLNGRTLVYHGL
ncbi:MAG: hypothetical protein AABX63_04695 [Nanoarchaeota archaeon]